MNTYGKLSNASLLHTYGFTLDDNPHDEVAFYDSALLSTMIYQRARKIGKELNLVDWWTT